MGLWSRLFGDPMEPLTIAVLKAARQDTFGVASYGDSNNRIRPALLLMCEFEFTHFYLSFALSLALAQMDPAKAFAFERRVKFTVLSRIVRQFCPSSSYRIKALGCTMLKNHSYERDSHKKSQAP